MSSLAGYMDTTKLKQGSDWLTDTTANSTQNVKKKELDPVRGYETRVWGLQKKINIETQLIDALENKNEADTVYAIAITKGALMLSSLALLSAIFLALFVASYFTVLFASRKMLFIFFVGFVGLAIELLVSKKITRD